MSRIPRVWAVVAALVAAASIGTAIPARADATTFSGRATALAVRAAGVDLTLGDTGELESSGGAKEASVLDVNVPGVLSAEVLHATVVGQDDRSRAHASVADLALTAGGHAISASIIRSEAVASCGPNGASVSGSVEVAHLRIDGQTYSVSGEPQTISLPGVTILINEQSRSSGSITVNAVHVTALGTDITIASAHADIVCAGNVGGCRADFVTGGGWIDGHGDKANFAAAGGIRNGYWGHLQYHDHGDGTTVKGTGVTAYTTPPLFPRVRHIEGTAEMNGQSGYRYSVDVDDEAEPGRDADSFAISVFPAGGGPAAYSNGGMLRGGNIQLHCRLQ